MGLNAKKRAAPFFLCNLRFFCRVAHTARLLYRLGECGNFAGAVCMRYVCKRLIAHIHEVHYRLLPPVTPV